MKLSTKLLIIATACLFTSIGSGLYLNSDRPSDIEKQHADNASKAFDEISKLSRQAEYAIARGDLDQSRAILYKMKMLKQSADSEQSLEKNYRTERNDRFAPFYLISRTSLGISVLIFISAWLCWPKPAGSAPTPRP